MCEFLKMFFPEKKEATEKEATPVRKKIDINEATLIYIYIKEAYKRSFVFDELGEHFIAGEHIMPIGFNPIAVINDLAVNKARGNTTSSLLTLTYCFRKKILEASVNYYDTDHYIDDRNHFIKKLGIEYRKNLKAVLHERLSIAGDDK